jgi:DNA-binding transcriptional ArsR family regulator
MIAAAQALDALGDGTRREIVRLLATRPASVRELADQLPVSRPAVSQHLRVLHDAQLVAVAPHGTQRIYRLDPRGAATLRGYLDRMWDTALDGFEAYVERSSQQSPKEEPR